MPYCAGPGDGAVMAQQFSIHYFVQQMIVALLVHVGVSCMLLVAHPHPDLYTDTLVESGSISRRNSEINQWLLQTHYSTRFKVALHPSKQ